MTAVVVVLDKDRPGRLAYFRSEAERVARELDADGPFPLHTGRELVELADRYESNTVDHLVVCAHGGAEWLIHPRTGVTKVAKHRNLGQVEVTEVIRAWSGPMTDTVLLSLCACLCGRSPRWWLRRYLGRIWSQVASTWGSRSYKPGGQGSISSSFRNMLVWFGHQPDVRNHRSAGDLHGNPMLSKHRGPASRLSIPLCELALPNVPITIGFRRWWVKTVRGKLAERWLLGDDSVVEEIATLWAARG